VPAQASDEAIAWLQKMGDALRQENYDGIFSYMRVQLFKNIQILIHLNYF
jgi:negative regulator of sigma E activity